jgi:ABC-type dipeptide/oligopeptide/nickel transport system permease subunit
MPLAFIILISILTLLYACGLDLSIYDFDLIDTNNILQAPSRMHWMGTDALGRDLFIRIIHGAKMSLSIAFLTAFITFFIGVSLGLVAGYKGGWIDEMISKLIDFLYSLPDLLILSLVALFVSRSTTGIVIGLAFINWMDLARIVRAETKRFKQEDFVESARVMGLSSYQIVLNHILPNISSSIIVALSFTVPRSIIAESTLSFIGLGISPPNTSWGTLAGDAWQFLRSDPHLVIFPALMIFLTVYSFNYLGDQLRDYLSPQKAGEHLL